MNYKPILVVAGEPKVFFTKYFLNRLKLKNLKPYRQLHQEK